MNILEYKGFHAKIEFDSETLTLRGKIESINDYVDFESDNPASIEAEFHSAVDDYLEFCKEVGKSPEKEYKGTFNVRIDPELHRKLALRALKEGCSLNAEVEKAIAAFISDERSQTKALVQSVQELTDTIRMDPELYRNETTVSSKKVIPFHLIEYTYSDEAQML